VHAFCKVAIPLNPEPYSDGESMRLNLGFVSTRFAGIDGVSLESSKWAKVLEDQGHTCFWFAGQLAKSEHIGLQASQANFKDDQNQWINSQLFGTNQKSNHR